MRPLQITFSNFDAPGNPWYGGGGASAIHQVARRLSARGHRVSVVTGRFPGSGPTTTDGVHYERRGAPVLGPRLGQLWFQLSLPLRVRRGDFDVWVESLTPPFSTACLQRFTRRPVVALTQVLAGRAMTRQYRLPFARVERAGLRTYRYAIATSEYLRGELLRVNPTLRVVVIPNGADPELVRHDPGPPAGEHLLFLGRLAIDQKGLDLLLSAVQAVSATLTLPLVIAGGGAPRDEAFLRRRIGELGLGARVRMVGPVQGAAKRDLLRRAAALVLPSRYEASPLVVAEAFCFRLPVVRFAIPELEELPATCCVPVAPFDVARFGQACVELAADVERRAAMGDAARAYAGRLDWDTLARAYEEFFECLPETR